MAQLRPGIGPDAVPDGASEASGISRLDRLEVQRARLAVGAGADVVAKTLANDRRDLLVPKDCTNFETNVVACDFGFDLAMTEGGIERFDSAKIFHGEFLYWRAPEWRLPARRR